MSTLTLTLPSSLHSQLELVAKREGVSLPEYVALALSEKVATVATADYLAERAKRGSRADLLAILAKAPDREPDEADRL